MIKIFTVIAIIVNFGRLDAAEEKPNTLDSPNHAWADDQAPLTMRLRANKSCLNCCKGICCCAKSAVVEPARGAAAPGCCARTVRWIQDDREKIPCCCCIMGGVGAVMGACFMICRFIMPKEKRV